MESSSFNLSFYTNYVKEFLQKATLAIKQEVITQELKNQLKSSLVTIMYILITNPVISRLIILWPLWVISVGYTWYYSYRAFLIWAQEQNDITATKQQQSDNSTNYSNTFV